MPCVRPTLATSIGLTAANTSSVGPAVMAEALAVPLLCQQSSAGEGHFQAFLSRWWWGFWVGVDGPGGVPAQDAATTQLLPQTAQPQFGPLGILS